MFQKYRYLTSLFDRPAWRRMISDIEDKKINLVITKDLSRLGRDYITAGQYTEIYFPAKGIRCIAINDGYDSDSPCTDIAPFKNVINEMYARDTSKKIRSAFQTKMQEGAYIGNFAPYGYRKDPENKNHLLVDYAVAPIVQELFQMAENGHAPSEIANAFNANGIMTPALYRCSKQADLNIDHYSQRKKWTSSMICKMLRNIVYLGCIAQGKTTKVSFKSRLTIQNPQDEWIVVENMHQPLVSRETFERVRKRSVSRRNPPKTNFSNLFSGIARCVDCGRNMSTSGTRKKGCIANLVCGGYKLYGCGECSNHFIDYELLYLVVLQEIKKLLSLTEIEQQELLDICRKSPVSKEKTAETDWVISLQKREKALDRIIERLYEDHLNEKLESARFYKMLATYEAEQKDITAQLAAFAKPQTPAAEEQESRSNFSALLADVTEVKELTPELLHKLVDKIEVFQGTYEKGLRGGHKHQTVRITYRLAMP